MKNISHPQMPHHIDCIKENHTNHAGKIGNLQGGKLRGRLAGEDAKQHTAEHRTEQKQNSCHAVLSAGGVGVYCNIHHTCNTHKQKNFLRPCGSFF